MSDLTQVDRYELNDGTSFSIAPGWGCNVFSWRVNGVELMYCPPELPANSTKITGGGNPILFPAVGRTWDRSVDPPVSGVYRIHGSDKTYFMPSHGILFLSEFHKTGEDRAGNSITATYDLRVPKKVREENYPFDVGMVHTFNLTPTTVELKATITNNGTSPAPAAFGYHPYFKLSSKTREGVEVHLPVARHLLVSKDTVLPTGETEPTDGVFRLQPDIYYDNAFDTTKGCRMSVIDRIAGRSVHVDFGDWAKLFLLYTPDGMDFVCIEPWTYGLGAYEDLQKPDWQTGKYIPVLQPGESSTYGSVFSVEFALGD